jgi:hypothetical protein
VSTTEATAVQAPPPPSNPPIPISQYGLTTVYASQGTQASAKIACIVLLNCLLITHEKKKKKRRDGNVGYVGYGLRVAAEFM